MDFIFKLSITSVVTSAVATAVVFIKIKHDNRMLPLWEMIKKFVLVRESLSTTPPPNYDATLKRHPNNDFLPKATTEQWNRANLGYLDPHLNRVHGKNEIRLVRKDVYYRNVMLFVYRLHNFVTFQGTKFINFNITTSFRGSVLEWYIFELSDLDRDALNNNSGVKSRVNTLSHRFKVPTSVALGFFTNETYTLDDAWAWQPLAQYVRAIMRYGIKCNIVDVVNHLFYAYQSLAPVLRVVVLHPTNSTNVAHFICTLEKKQKV